MNFIQMASNVTLNSTLSAKSGAQLPKMTAIFNNMILFSREKFLRTNISDPILCLLRSHTMGLPLSTSAQRGVPKMHRGGFQKSDDSWTTFTIECSSDKDLHAQIQLLPLGTADKLWTFGSLAMSLINVVVGARFSLHRCPFLRMHHVHPSSFPFLSRLIYRRRERGRAHLNFLLVGARAQREKEQKGN